MVTEAEVLITGRLLDLIGVDKDGLERGPVKETVPA